MQELIAHQETINRQLARYGVKFGIYKNGEFKERLFRSTRCRVLFRRRSLPCLIKGFANA